MSEGPVSPSQPVGPGLSRNGATAKALLLQLLALLWLTFPFSNALMDLIYHVDCGLIYALNYFARQGIEYGREYFCTYGPLGYLLQPVAVDGHLIHANLFSAVLYAALLAGIWKASRERGDYFAFMPLVAALICFNREQNRDNVLFPAIALIYYVLDLRAGRRSLLFMIPVLMAAVCAFVKFNIGLAQAVLFVGYLAAARVVKKDPWIAVALKALAAFAALGLGTVFLFASPSDFLSYVRVTWIIAAGHSPSLSMAVNPNEVVSAVVILGVFAWALKMVFAERGRAWGCVWSFWMLALLGLAFKHGFVRSDWHIIHFFFSVPVLMALMALALPLRRLAMPLLIVIILSTSGMAFRFPSATPWKPVKNLSLKESRKLWTMFHANERRERENARHLAAWGLSAEEKKAIGNATVNVLPFDAMLLGQDLRWKPTPVHPMYMATTPELDRMNAEHLRSSHAAEFVILKWQNIDGRHPLYSSPRAYEALIENYDYVMTAENRMLLRRASSPRRFERKPLGEAQGSWLHLIDIPRGQGMVEAQIQLEYTLLGRILNAVYRTPPVIVTLHADDGKEISVRFDPLTARTGIWVSRVPVSRDTFRPLVEPSTAASGGRERVVMTLLYESKLPYFTKTFRIRFNDMTLKKTDEIPEIPAA